MTVNIICETDCRFSFHYKELAKKVIAAAIREEEFPFEAEISLTLTDDESIRVLNREYRGIDRATDVLSFPLLEYERAGDFSELEEDPQDSLNPDTGEIMLGDIVISVQRVYGQAEEYGHSVKREYAFLIVHSMLHLFGYDHITKHDEQIMKERQNRILQELHILR